MSDQIDLQKEWGLATTAFSAGKFDEAIALAKQLHRILPTVPAFLQLLGKAEIARGDPQNAIGPLKKAAELDPNDVVAWLLLGDALHIHQQWVSAVDPFLNAVSLSPGTALNHAKLFQLLASRLRILPQERKPEDVAEVGRAFHRWVRAFVGESGLQDALVRLDHLFGQRGSRDDRLLFSHLSHILLFSDYGEEAVTAFSNSTVPVENATADEMKDHETLRGDYREIASTYDDNGVAQICSKTLADLAIDLVGDKKDIRILDAACGTGLVGCELKELADKIVGIDLSSDMLIQAEKKGVYDQLTIGDISVALKEEDGSFDLVTSACALYHLSDLSGFFAGAASCLIPGGVLVISVDPCVDIWEVRATLLGGFAHSRRYLRRLAAENGFEEIGIKILEHRAHPGFFAAFSKSL